MNEVILFVLQAMRDNNGHTAQEKNFWTNQYRLFMTGIRDERLHDYTLVSLTNGLRY